MTLSWAILEKTPFLLLAVASSAVTFIVQQSRWRRGRTGCVSGGAQISQCAGVVSALRGKIILAGESLRRLYPLPASWPVLLVAAAGGVCGGIVGTGDVAGGRGGRIYSSAGFGLRGCWCR